MAVCVKHLIYEKLLPGDPRGLLNSVLSLWGLLDGHLTARLGARDLQSTTLLTDLLSIFKAGWALEAVEIP